MQADPDLSSETARESLNTPMTFEQGFSMTQDARFRKIWEFLGELGWPHDVVAQNIIKTQYDGHFGPVKVMIQVRTEGLRMAINPVLAAPEEGWQDSVKRLLRTLDAESQMINVGFDKEGDIFVKVDLPSADIEFEQFVYVLFNLCQVSEQLLVPVLQARAYDRHEAALAEQKDAA